MEGSLENRVPRTKNEVELEIMGLRIKLQQLEIKTAIGGSTEMKPLIESEAREQEIQKIEAKIKELRQEVALLKA